MKFIIDGVPWRLVLVPAGSPELRKADGSVTVGMTDGALHEVYIWQGLKGSLFEKVLTHELCHCFCFSHEIVIPLFQEEFLATWVSSYGRDLFELVDNLKFKSPAGVVSS